MEVEPKKEEIRDEESTYRKEEGNLIKYKKRNYNYNFKEGVEGECRERW